MGKTVTYRNGRLESGETEVVQEFPLKLIVNHREVATLICSPHDLRFLTAGFLRLQGFVRTVDDFLMLSVCNDFGIANVDIRGDVPDKLKPVLTSGCGAGISFTLGQPTKNMPAKCGTSHQTYLPAEIFGMMEQLARLAENYKCHGGIHSAAVGDGTSILLYAEDLGRHNTLDRIAGEALLKGIDLSGTMLVTSGRVSRTCGQGGNARHIHDCLPHLADQHGGEDVRGGGDCPHRLCARRAVHHLYLSGEDCL